MNNSNIQFNDYDITFKPTFGDMYLLISVINGTEIEAKQQILDNQEIVERLKQRIDEVQEFVDGCEEAKNMPDSIMSPIAGLMEKSELEELKKILGEDNLGEQ